MSDRPETNADYHADLTHVGSSMLSDYATSPALFNALYVAKTLPPDPPTPAMVLGSLVHVLVLQPEKLVEEYLIAGDCTTRRGKAWDAGLMEAALEFKTLVLPSQVDDARAMADAVKAHPLASTILERAECIEQAIRWTDPTTGLKLKCKADFLVRQEGERPVVLAPDLKTTADLATFPSSVAKYGYHRQSRLYANGIARWYTGGDDTRVDSLWIVVDKTPPHDVRVFRPSPAMNMQAQIELDVLLERLARSFATDTWELPDSNIIETVELPRWAQH